jgi:hypothetical protein
MVDSRWQGKTVVMVWEHKHIANKKLEHSFPREAVTLRQLLKTGNASEMATAKLAALGWAVVPKAGAKLG